MEKKSKKIKKWFSRNKTKVIIGGCVAAIAIGGVIACANRDAITPNIKDTIDKIRELLNKCVTDKSASVTSGKNLSINASRDTAKQPINGGLPFSVKGHPRTLPKNRHASPKKIAEAQAAGIKLKGNQTFVKDYIKNAA